MEDESVPETGSTVLSSLGVGRPEICESEVIYDYFFSHFRSSNLIFCSQYHFKTLLFALDFLV